MLTTRLQNDFRVRLAIAEVQMRNHDACHGPRDPENMFFSGFYVQLFLKLIPNVPSIIVPLHFVVFVSNGVLGMFLQDRMTRLPPPPLNA